MEIIRLRKINNLDPKECCGMKKSYIKLSVIFLLPVVLLVLVLSGVATIVKAKSLIKYYDTVCQYNYEKIMSTIYNMDKSTNDFFDDDKMFCQYAKFLSDNRLELFSELRVDGLMHYFSIYVNVNIKMFKKWKIKMYILFHSVFRLAVKKCSLFLKPV